MSVKPQPFYNLWFSHAFIYLQRMFILVWTQVVGISYTTLFSKKWIVPLVGWNFTDIVRNLSTISSHIGHNTLPQNVYKIWYRWPPLDWWVIYKNVGYCPHFRIWHQQSTKLWIYFLFDCRKWRSMKKSTNGDLEGTKYYWTPKEFFYEDWESGCNNSQVISYRLIIYDVCTST